MMDCRPGCGACCIAPSISAAIPGMPQGKPAGIRCVQLNDDNSCALFGQPQRPLACRRLRPCPSMCGTHRDEAMEILQALEITTQPNHEVP